MPLYEYQCTQCGYRYEKIQKFNSERDSACPKCGGELHLPLTAPALQFKGAGWYVNDYAPKGGGSRAADKPAAETPGTADTKAGESKPAPDSKPAATETTPKATAAPSSSSSSS